MENTGAIELASRPAIMEDAQTTRILIAFVILVGRATIAQLTVAVTIIQLAKPHLKFVMSVMITLKDQSVKIASSEATETLPPRAAFLATVMDMEMKRKVFVIL